MRSSRWTDGILHPVTIVLVAFLAAACATYDERWTDLGGLRDLKVGSSTQSDVARVLGLPGGKGAARMESHDRRTIWFYHKLEFQGFNPGTGVLLVFFLDGVYDGHLWFQSGAEDA